MHNEMISKIWFNVSTPLRKVFICNIEIGNSNWLLCNTVAVSEMNLFASETIWFHNSFVWEYLNLYQMCQYEQNVLVFMKMFFLLFGYRSCHDTIHVPVYQGIFHLSLHIFVKLKAKSCTSPHSNFSFLCVETVTLLLCFIFYFR